MDSFSSNNNVLPNDAVDVLMPNDTDPMDDVFHREESHYRRSSYHATTDDRDNGNTADDSSRDRRHESRDRSGLEDRRDSHGGGGRGRSRSPGDRSREHHSSGSNRGHHDRDDKYDGDRRSSHDHERRGRSRSRSPGRAGSSGSALRDRRVYVGNLTYDVKWTNLKDFMRQIGPVAHADVLLGSDGRSKGCGVVEYQNADDAKEAIRKLNDVMLLGRPVFVREDRESEARIGFSGGRGSGLPPSRGTESGTRQVYVANLPYSVNWKDMKDLFRRAGPVDRADVFTTTDMRSKGSGTVLFERSGDVSRAVSMFNGFEWHGRRIEVREDKFGPPAGGATRSSSKNEPAPARGSSRGEDFGRGGSSSFGGDSFSYGNGGHGDYNRHESSSSSSRAQHDLYDGSSRTSRHASNYNDIAMDVSIPSGPAAGSGDQIYIRNLPFTTTEQDLRDLFRTCGPIRMTEIIMEGGRPKGSGVVRFEMFESADKAVAKFNGYKYGGRPLEIMYDRV
ncbi:hypothetical protein EDD21DRAFT_369983 [Dissophora ornata]|nr:hypothetical protein EDD21DRAFT_369983 [Dissophora ornata]